MDRVSDRRIADRESRRAAAFDWHCEPRIDAVLADPVVRLMMARDGVSSQQLMTLLCSVRHTAVSGRS